ncbi:ABC transporter ATP-binding protein [Ruegeria hyattellae]|uniref:ABC transporter ATP-binding protein n=1 Tax=Ruegeria hyattellae TaxID=3233337 RepID=UPI00355AED30
MTEIKLKEIRKSYGDVEVIHGIDLTVRSGEFCVFVGPSGCGKSTLLRLIAGLDTVTSGTIEIDGEPVNNVSASSRGLAMVFQSYALYPHMSVYKNMAFGLENSKMPKPEIERRVREAAEMLQITDYLHRKPKALSGGQRQRVAIGRAIVREPKAFLLDEPLSNLDAELRVTMRKELAALHANIGDTMIYVTHDQTEAMTLADKIVVLQSGRIEQTGAPLDLYNNPQNVFVAGFIGSPRMNLIETTAVDGPEGWTLTAPNLSVTIPKVDGLTDGARCTLGIRPEHVRVGNDEIGHTTSQVAFAEQLGGETYLYCNVEGLPQITVHQPGQLPVVNGQTLALSFELEDMHLFDADGQVIVNRVAG